VASKSLEEWLKILWENDNEYVVCEVLLCLCSSVRPPAAGGSPPLL
jgi:hypothetical protein